jgi:Anti-sigma-K factor rskA/Sigma-70, region 4
VATFDQLSAEQKAILELVLKQGRSYGQLADTLGMSEARVRELARDALVELAPISAQRVEDDWRGQLADYVLGQQSGPETTATRGHLRRSEAARSWMHSLLDSLDGLYEDRDAPVIPDSERGRDRSRRAAAHGPSGQAAAAPRRRRRRLLAGVGALALVVLAAVLMWPVGVLMGDDDGDGASGGTVTNASSQQTATRGPAGIAIVADRNGKRQLIVQAAGLQPSGQNQAYEVWLYNSRTDAKSIGAQVTDQNGNYQGAGPLPADYSKYRFIDVSREPVNKDPSHSGDSVLRGRVTKLRNPPANRKPGQASILGQVVLAPPG